MEELVQDADNIPIFTLGMAVSTRNFKHKIYTFLTARIIPSLVADETLNKRLRDMYSRLKNVVRTALNSSHDIVSDFSTYVIMWYSDQSEVVVGKQGMFAVVDSSCNLKPFGHMLALFGKYKSARPHNSMSFFTGRIYWYVQNNFFVNLFATGLSSMIESGIYGWWYKNGNIQKPLLQYYASYGKIYKGQSQLIGTEFEATTLELVSGPMHLYLGMLLISLAVFLYEFRCTLKTLELWAVNLIPGFTTSPNNAKRGKINAISGIP